MATVTRKISQDTWNLHKETILSLYLTSDHSLKDLVQIMDRDHGFSASSSQFEAQLKVWKARKNLKRLEWEQLLEKIDGLSSQGIQSRVVISGHPVSTNKVHRARRYCKGKSHLGKRRRDEADLDETMENVTTSDVLIEVQDQSGRWTQHTTMAKISDTQADFSSTPGIPRLDTQLHLVEDSDDRIGLLHDERPIPPGPGNASLLHLPFDTSFDNSFSTGGSQYFPPFMDEPFIGPEPSESQSFLQNEPNFATAFSTLEVVTSPLRLVDTTPFPFGTLFPEELPFKRFERELISKGLKLTDCPSPLQDSRLLFGASKLTSMFIHETAIAMSRRNEKSNQENFYNAWRSLQTLGTILPRDQHGYDNGSIALCTQEMSDVDLHRLLLLSAANGFIGMGDIPIETALRFLDRNSNITSLLPRVFQENRSPIARSLAENLFRASIEACDHQKTRFFLQMGLVDVDNTIYFVNSEKRTPIERAAELQGLKVVKELLIFKPDVRRALGYLIKGRCPTNWYGYGAKRDHSLFTPDFIGVLDALIEAGAEICSSSIEQAFRGFVDTSLAETLLNRLTPSFHSEAFEDDIPILIARAFPDDIAQTVMAKIISQCEQVGCKACMSKYSDTMKKALVSGAKRGLTRLVQFLLKYAKCSLALVLSAAIQSGNQELINYLLDQNIDLRRAPAEKLDSKMTTPLAEAIIAGDKILIGILEKRTVLHSLKDEDVSSSHFASAMAAAAQVGDIDYMKKLLLLHHHIDYKGIAGLFDAAVEYQQEDVVRFLLDIGICHLDIYMTSTTNWFFKVYKRGNKSLLLHMMSNIPGLIFRRITGGAIEDSKLEDVDMFNFFCKSGRATKEFLTDCLRIAVKNNDIRMLHSLLRQGADATDEIMLMYAVGRPDTLRIILAHIPPNHRGDPGFGQTAVHTAILGRNTEALDILLKCKSIDYESLKVGTATPLSTAIRRDADCSGLIFPFTTRILSTGCDINGIIEHDISNRLGSNVTPLLAAIKTRNKNLVQFIISRGANINKEARYGVRQTPLQAAAQVGSLDIVELLLHNGADVNAKPALHRGGTALQFAAMSGNCNIVVILMNYGASVYDAPSEFGGIWPIEAAAEHGRVDMIQFLWNASIFGIPIEQCRKAIRLAEKNGHGGCKELVSTLAVSSGIMPALEG
ncbi:ankyrin [Annulohypoxylon truncatum]|uniref:ankyrin n=1 Tax=Annulohypoxylon truncatum TaxID=327061 RepID=UPI0020073FE9|nr:ankyrin [Annulohypoxylon truncatum]KAI1214756.1 ankyrin [Annulohypoxylon truncatum]